MEYVLTIDSKMQGAKRNSYFRKAAIVLILVGILATSYAFSALSRSVIIVTNGIISGSEITAQSGSPADIQTAVNAVAAAGGGKVHIPAGNFTFNILQDGFNGLGCKTGVQVPGGVNVIGAGNNQTILYVPINAWDSANHGTYVKTVMFTLNGANNRPIRISGIYFQGSVNYSGGPTTDTYAQLSGILSVGVKDFRIDHCKFVDFTDYAIMATNNWVNNPNGNCGVIDHCSIDNPYKNIYLQLTGGQPLWAYGIIVAGTGWPTFNTDYTQFFGQYHHDIVYIEDCDFARCRHMIAGGSQSNAFYVLRYSTMTDMILAGYGSYQDVHGGGEGAECYGNTIINTRVDSRSENPPESDFGKYAGIGFYSRGGFALYYNNTIRNFEIGSGITLANDQSNSNYRTRNVWIWNNTYVNVATQLNTMPNSFPIRENIEYFLRAPSQTQDGFTYTPYPYPHPLTIETSP